MFIFEFISLLFVSSLSTTSDRARHNQKLFHGVSILKKFLAPARERHLFSRSHTSKVIILVLEDKDVE